MVPEGTLKMPDVDDLDEPSSRDTWFNPFRAPKTERARALVGDVLLQVQNYEDFLKLRQRARRPTDQESFEATVRAIISDLIHFHLTDHSGGLVVTRSKQILGKPSRYRPAVYSRTFPVIVDRLASPEMAFVEQSKGHVLDFELGVRKRTTLRPGSRLLSAITERGLTLADLTTSTDGELIVLKSEPRSWWDEASYIEYQDTEVTERFREEMRTINRWLEAADLSFDEGALSSTERSDLGRKVNVSERRLRRIFTREKFDSGGRLFGGFWQPLPKIIRRKGVRIDGEGISVLDYSQMNPRIAYALANTVPPMEDVYRVPGFEDAAYRPGMKQLFNAMLFATKPIKRMPKGIGKKFPAKVNAKQAVQSIVESHTALTFFKGHGHHIMFLESQIMVRLLLDLRQRNITGLPVHDAVAVPQSRAEEVRQIMVDQFRAATGVDVQVTEDALTARITSTPIQPP
jgi:hypothetical protein